MPDFSSIRNIMNVDKKLTGLELARAIRFGIAAEYEAVYPFKKQDHRKSRFPLPDSDHHRQRPQLRVYHGGIKVQ